MEVERIPITRLETEQDTNTSRNEALTLLETKMTALQTSAAALKVTSLYDQRTASSSVSGSTWGLSASEGASTGSYSFAVTQLATAAKRNGAANVGASLNPDEDLSTLPTGTAVTAGTITINGTQITISLESSLNEVLTQIQTATGVTAAYNAGTDTISLTGTEEIVLGSANDTSNFLTAMRLRNNGTTSVISNEDPENLGTPLAGLGSLSLSGILDNARTSTPLTSGAGSFQINGIEISYDTTTESLNAIIAKINSSDAGVTASYDSVNDRMILVNNATGDIGFSVSDTTGNLMAALGLTSPSGATLQAGKDAIFTVNGGGTLYSRSNTLDASIHGIAGLSVTAKNATTETISVTADTGSTKSKIEDFIAKFNDVQDFIEEKTKITTTNGKVTTSILSNNSEVYEYARRMRSTAFAALTGLAGSIDQIDDLGIDFRSGTDKLEIKDATKLDTALSSNMSSVKEFFTTSSSGFIASFETFFTSSLGTTVIKGSLDYMKDGLVASNTSIDKQIADIERRLTLQREIMESAFIRMEEAQQKTQNILTQLTNSFSNNN